VATLAADAVPLLAFRPTTHAERTAATAIDRAGSDLTPTSCEIRRVETRSAVKQEFRQNGCGGATGIGAASAHG
jgi:hypothetical protein